MKKTASEKIEQFYYFQMLRSLNEKWGNFLLIKSSIHDLCLSENVMFIKKNKSEKLTFFFSKSVEPTFIASAFRLNKNITE